MTDLPNGPSLLEEARHTLLDSLLPLLPPDRRYDGLMIANAMAIAAREAAEGEALLRKAISMLSVLLQSPGVVGSNADLPQQLLGLERRLADEIRTGLYDSTTPRRDAARDYLRWSTVVRLRISNPKALS